MARRRTGPTAIQRSREQSPSEKAAYHQLTGAGRRRVMRPFFGLSAADEDAIERDLDVRISVNLDREGFRSA